MSYRAALEAAGAEVLQFEEFGSYQGEWWAKVRMNGEEGWISGSYGSCSGCDAFEAEFGWDDQDSCDKHSYDPQPDCDVCKAKKALYQARLAAFGKPYLDGLMTQERAEKAAAANIDWDGEVGPMLAYIKANAVAREAK